jgi:hypothetical protein
MWNTGDELVIRSVRGTANVTAHTNAYMSRTGVEFGMSFTLVARITKPGRRHTPELDELFAPTPDSYPLPRAILVGAGGASCQSGTITRVQSR